MIEKIGHVNNPLTIIAIFAGLAEVSGTIVLPLLKENIQSTYIWFLMFFPSILVILFFFTLFFKREVLYAPSDFHEDASFISLFRPSKKSRLDIINEDVEEEEIKIKKEERMESSQKNSYDIIRANSLLAVELVLTKLSRELNVNFKRNVSPKYDRNLYFDAVATTSTNMFVVEIKFSSSGSLPSSSISSVFNRVNTFYLSLNKEMKEKFIFFFAVVVDNVESTEKIRSIEKDVISQNKFSYDTIVEIYKFQELLEKEKNSA